MPANLLVTTADFAPALSVAFADVPGLTFAVAAGVTYAFEFNLLVVAGATTTGHAVAVNGPLNPTYLRYTWTVDTTTTAVQIGGSGVYDHAIAPPATSASATAANPAPTSIRGIIIPSMAGVLACRIKPEVAATITVQRGSYGVVSS